ncbi:MAG: Holliday junction branch migration protein RuvA [Alphaproteobacteria bacterium]|nr:Holliday junction branch migration protein RuvA [Alphaproteobacteria bacterium]
MIAKLRGIIDTIGDDYCIIDVNGVGYLVYASAKTLSRLIKGNQFSLLIETVVREDSISLFGFYDAWEKEWFLTLTKVQGVGAKVCLSILSALTPSQLAQAVSAQDKASFTRASGVGPKLAARLVTELKDKIVTIPTELTTRNDLQATPETKVDAAEETVAYEDAIAGRIDNPMKLDDAISALVNLGYQRLEAYQAVNKANAANPDADVASLIRLALKEFAPKE